MCVCALFLPHPFIGLQVAKNATTTPSSISEREASIKFQFFLLSASWPPWNLIIVMYCPKCSPRPGHKRQPIPLPAELSEEYWSYFKPFDSVSQENFLNVLYYCRNEWTHKLWMGRVGQSRSLCISLFSTWQSSGSQKWKLRSWRFIIKPFSVWLARSDKVLDGVATTQRHEHVSQHDAGRGFYVFVHIL